MTGIDLHGRRVRGVGGRRRPPNRRRFGRPASPITDRYDLECARFPATRSLSDTRTNLAMRDMSAFRHVTARQARGLLVEAAARASRLCLVVLRVDSLPEAPECGLSRFPWLLPLTGPSHAHLHLTPQLPPSRRPSRRPRSIMVLPRNSSPLLRDPVRSSAAPPKTPCAVIPTASPARTPRAIATSSNPLARYNSPINRVTHSSNSPESFPKRRTSSHYLCQHRL